METFISDKCKVSLGGIDLAKVLIATVYSADPVLLASNRLGPDRLVLLVNTEITQEEEKSLKIIKNSLGRVIDVKVVKTSTYDIVEIATKCVDIIDMQPKDDIIYVNVTSGRKTKALGLLFAAYARHERIKKIAYNPEEDKNAVVYLPKLSFNLNDSQHKVLDTIAEGKYTNHTELADKTDISRAMLYKNIKELHDMDLISTEEGFALTDAGKIARL